MKKGPHKMMLEASRYDKWERGGVGGGGAAGGSSGGGGGGWASRERDRERERQARAHQMSQPPEPDASSLFPAPFREFKAFLRTRADLLETTGAGRTDSGRQQRYGSSSTPNRAMVTTSDPKVNGNKDRVSQQIQNKLGDYHLAQTLLDDPSKSIGICHEPPSPAPCPPSRRERERESEFKKPAHAPQNGRVHSHRPYMYNKSDAPTTTSAPAHRPPNLRIPNGYHPQSTIDSSQPPIESILREMKSLPTPLSVIEATPRKELENKFTFNPYTNRLVPNPPSNDLKSPSLPKPGLDNRISNSRSSASPDVVNKDLGLSESDDEVAATTTRLEPILSPIGSGGSPSSGSESSPSDSESSSSSESSNPPPPAPAPPPPAPVPAPAHRSSWSLSNFAPPPANPPDQQELRNALDDVKGKPSPISSLSDSDEPSPSPAARRRQSTANRSSALSSDDEARPTTSPRQTGPQKRGRPPKKSTSSEPPKKKRGRPRKLRPDSPPPDPPEPPPQPLALHDMKTQIFRKVFTPKKGDEGGGKGGKGGKGKGGKGKGQVTIIEVTAPESDDDRRHRDRSAERRNEEAIARVSPPPEPEPLRRRDERRRSNERADYRIPDRIPTERTSNDRIPTERTSNDRIPTERTSNDRISDRLYPERRIERDRLSSDRLSDRDRHTSDRDRITSERLSSDRHTSDRLSSERLTSDRLSSDRLNSERILSADRLSVSSDRLSSDRSADRLSTDRLSSDRLHPDRLSSERSISERLSSDKMSDKLTVERISEKMSVDRLDVIVPDRYVRAEADVGSGLKTGRGSERQEEASSVSERRMRSRLVVRVPLSRLRAETVRALQRPPIRTTVKPATPPACQGVEVAATNHERAASGQTPIYYSYFERLPADVLSDEERDHKYYLGEAKRLRTAAEREQEPLQRVMLYLESVLCFVLTGRVLELELDTKRAFTIYRETIEYIKSIHSMPQRFRASPHSTFSKLDILSLRVQALLYLRMFKMYNREVKEYYKIVQEYQQKVPACPESVSPLSPTPSPAGSVNSVGSAASASSGYCSLAHAVPAHAHNALLQLTKYYTFLYVAHELWEQADCLCRLRANQDLFIAVDRKCGPLTLFSTFRHLVQYVRHAISLLKSAPRE